MRLRLGAALTTAVALAAAAVLPAGARSPMITASRQATPADLAVRAYGSPGVVVDPDDPRNVFAAGVDFRSARCAFQRSADGGATWREVAQGPSVPGAPRCTHNLGQIPVGFLAMGRDKTLYWAFSASSIEDTPNLSVFLGRSEDFGETWTAAPVRDARGKRGLAVERNLLMDLAVDTTRENGDAVYVSWMGGVVQGTPPPTRQGEVAASIDGGRTFAEPVDVADGFFSDPANLAPGVSPAQRAQKQVGALQPNLAVDGRGKLYVVWLELVVGDPFHSPVRWRRMFVSRSSDQGRSFTEHTLVRAMTTDGVGLIGPMLEWSPRGGPEGSLHLVYESRETPAQGDRDVQYQRSVDGNRTWSAVKVVNDDDPRQLFGQFLPNVAVAPNGRVDVAWWDMRDGALAYANDVYYSYSEDAGASWSPNFRVSDRSIDRKLGIWTNNSDTRQPPGLASANELAVVVWDDTRNADAVDGAQDLRAAAVQFEDLGTGASQRILAYGLAGLAGAGAVGLVLLVTGLMGHRRRVIMPVS